MRSHVRRTGHDAFYLGWFEEGKKSLGFRQRIMTVMLIPTFASFPTNVRGSRSHIIEGSLASHCGVFSSRFSFLNLLCAHRQKTGGMFFQKMFFERGGSFENPQKGAFLVFPSYAKLGVYKSTGRHESLLTHIMD